MAVQWYDSRMPKINEGIAPPDYETPVGEVRSLTTDQDPEDVSNNTGSYFWHSDLQIRALLKQYDDSPKRVAIVILRQVAMTPAMQYKKWSSADLTVDGPAITRALRDLINDIEKSMGAADAEEVSTFFAIVPTGPAMAQPAFHRDLSYGGRDIDTTLPWIP